MLRSETESTANEDNSLESETADKCTYINNETSVDEEESSEDEKARDWAVVVYTGY